MTVSRFSASALGARAVISFCLIACAACAPKIYVVDRQTVLEQEAAGEWPEFDKELIAKSLAKGPAPLGKLPPSEAQRRLYNVPNGDLSKSPPSPSRKGAGPDQASPKAGDKKARGGK